MMIDDEKLIKSSGKKDNSFVGIKILNNEIEFHYPETYVLSNDDKKKRKDILTILRTLSLAKTKTKDTSSYYTDANNNYELPLQSFLWIINDYLKTGRYPNLEKLYEEGTKGKINWKKTLDNDPIISNHNIVYTKIISERKDQKDNILTEAYECCAKQAIDAIGWIFSLKFDKFDKNYNELFKKKKKLYLAAITTQLIHTYEDSKKFRLQHMKNIITGLSEDIINTNEILYGVDSYEYVYEKMVDSMFSNIKNIKEFYPNAIWDLKVENSKINSSNLRPDTIIVKDNKVYILDAKYYRYGTTFNPKDIPNTDSIQKQITYGEYIKQKKNDEYDEIYSAFVMPYSKTTNKYSDRFNKDMEFVGTATANWFESNNETNRRIVAILLDTNFLINNWIKKNDDNLDDIIQLIEGAINNE